MRITRVFLLVWTGLLCLGQSVAADPVQWTANGHYYDIVGWPTAVYWPEARDLASGMTWQGCQGHLATITTPEEQAFLQQTFGVYMDMCWLGGYQDPRESPPAENWHWVTGEPWIYTNWRSTWPPEPNDSGGGEFYLEVHGGANQTWNDVGDVQRPFMVEYESAPTPSRETTWGRVKALYR